MRHFILPAVLLSGTFSPTQAAAATPLAAPVQRDLQCFMLYAMAVDHAVKEKDEEMRQGAGLSLIYYLGKLKAEAPTLVFADTIREEAETLIRDPKIKELAKSCDTEFQTAGTEMRNLGGDLTGKSDAAPSK
jgi:hypothetical protein